MTRHLTIEVMTLPMGWRKVGRIVEQTHKGMDLHIAKDGIRG